MMNQMTSMVGPMMSPQTTFMPPGSMTSGMGIVGGAALSETRGDAFGRTTPTRPRVPGYPQDMFMPMDAAVAKPETYGMRPGWSGGTMGMMTVVRVLTPELFDRIQQLKADAGTGREPR